MTPREVKPHHSPKTRIKYIIKELTILYPEVESELITRNPYEKVVATILSAQCTDKRVNMVTPALFSKFPDVYSMAEASKEELEKDIHSTGFFRNKAKNILGMAKMVIEDFNGEIPTDMENLLKLPGVARKTANCVLNDCFNNPSGVVVDTHVARLSIRLGLTTAKKSNAVQIEKDLMKLVPVSHWINFSHRMIFHGRRVCNARKPRCNDCTLLNLCPFGNKT